MSNNIAKSQSLIRALKDQLSKRLPAYTIQESLVNSAGDSLMISQSASPTAGQNNIAIRVGFQDTQFTNVIGQPQDVYTPMRADLIEEAMAAGPWVVTATSFNATIGAVYQSANGSVFSVNNTVVAGTVLNLNGLDRPDASGILTRLSGTGDASITYASFVAVSPAPGAAISLCSMAFQQAIAAELNKMGIKQRWYLNAKGTVPAVSEFAADGSVTTAVLQIELAPDQYWPLSGQ